MRTDELVGKQIGEFTITERIGRGGMATVYRAKQPSMHRDVALKILALDDVLEDENFRQRFAQEAEMIASLEHIHILPVYSYGIQGDTAFLAMRLLKGGSLSDLMKNQAMPIERCVDLFSQIAQGLAYAHSKGIVHRDLKPTNILLDEVGHAYLTDFGLAKLVDGETQMTKTGNIVGTPAYMSPEQLRGEPLDHRSDIYSLGVILYQMLTGKRPFDGDSSDVVSIIYKHLEKMPPRPSIHNPGLTPEIENIVMRALAKDPNDRFKNVGEMATRLQAATGVRSSANFPVPSIDLTTTSIHRRRTKNRRLITGIAVAAVAVLVLIGGYLLTNRPGTDIYTPPTIVAGQKGVRADAVPTTAEIERAKQVLGSDGFIAILPCNLESEYHATVTREMVETARHFGVATRTYNSQNDAYRQTTLIETARIEGAKAFIVCPLDESLSNALQALDAADYPLVLPAGSDEDLNYGGIIVNTDNYSMGFMPGLYGGELIRDELGGQARVIILDYPTLGHIVQRADGLEDGILENAPDAVIVGRYLGATVDFAKESVAKLIANGVEFNVIASINDAGAYGAIEAMEEAGIDPSSVLIVSVDAEERAQRYIQDGYFMRGSVALPRTEFANANIELIIKQLAGSTLPEIIALEAGEVVTKESLETP